jgi:hypothetical protein
MIDTYTGIEKTIHERRTVNQFSGEPVSTDLIMELHMGYFDKTKVRRPKPRTPVSELLTLIE